MKKGLVLEGGAMRGLFSAGVMDVMYEAGLEFDGIVGVSAGAAFGCNYKSRQPGRAIRYNKLFAHDGRYCGLRSLLTTGDLYGGEYDYHYIPTHVDVFDTEAFEKNPVRFHVVCTDVETGAAVYQKIERCDYDAFEWIRASASMPMVSRIVNIGSQKLLDGGIADSIPLEYFEREGYDRNVVILTQPQGYEKRQNRLLPLLRLSLRKYPNIIKALANRHLMYNDQLRHVAEAERAGRAFVIRPSIPLPIGHISHDPEEMQRVYDIGRAEGARQLPALRQFLAAPSVPNAATQSQHTQPPSRRPKEDRSQSYLFARGFNDRILWREG